MASRCQQCGKFVEASRIRCVPCTLAAMAEDERETAAAMEASRRRFSVTVVSEDPGRGELLEKISADAKTAGQKPVKRWWRRRPTSVRWH